MNPILLKSGGRRESDGAYLCSVIVLGEHYATEDYGALGSRTSTLMELVVDAHDRLDAEVVILEGAGSCTELNLMERDVVNIPLVRRLNCPWLLVANIDPGGVFAQVVGTKACLSKEDWDLCVGVIVNKLRGEVKYFEPGPSMLEKMVEKPIFVIPYLYDINIAEEDGMGLERKLANENSLNKDPKSEKIRVVVICYPHISMTDDLMPVERDSKFSVEWRRNSTPATFPKVIVLAGSRQTRSDLAWLQASHWKSYLQDHVAQGGIVLGLCGGYQMLGQEIVDELGVESGTPGTDTALGLLPVTTTLESTNDKIVMGVQQATLRFGSCGPVKVDGFEIHCGRTSRVGTENDTQSLLQFPDGRFDGITTGQVHGTYLHGILQSREARASLLGVASVDGVDDDDDDDVDPLDRLAQHLEAHGLDYQTLSNMIFEHDTAS